jgi:BolA family transcriptional regulator, general stress-responsive regulator
MSPVITTTSLNNSDAAPPTSVRAEIMARLDSLQPSFVELRDESARHAGHTGAAAHAARQGAAHVATEGTHFELTIVSPQFANQPLMARHRQIYALLDDLMKTKIHALSIVARSQ